MAILKVSLKKKSKKHSKRCKNTPNNSNKDKTQGIAKLFLPNENFKYPEEIN